MIIAIQLLVLLLIALSTVLVVGVPVVLASPGQWEQSKGLVYTGAGLWTGLVIVTSLVNSLVV
uniref:Photosystem II reaction center protein Z n=1 Tax=Pyropia perforata TaxID=182771 RepID=A0A023HRE7_PYRPE|nr:photosystem II protein Z [Neoporphyra perforata]AGQ17130.1 photosystem II protein Z [Neoporphyra perforata]AHB35092.1 photosystem II protein Z [Neoporphyra perforata]AIA19463.1 photosystem II protein Z [Neoporphyra perforata]AIA19672.1 photosystem II protein Z [Neoporphyra perforata]AIA19881.1 photosystem II protein Z [Neoporphyra perforata]